MPMFERGGIRLHYREAGNPEGPPALLIAPGGMRSTLEAWSRMPWNPMERLAAHRVIAMDQRNAGQSTAPITAADGWDSYTADQLALLDHLGVDRFDVVGMCIGGPYIMGLIRAAPARVKRAVMFQPIGLEDNREAFCAMFDDWAKSISDQHPEATEEVWAAFRHAMFGGDYMFNAQPEDVQSCPIPVLLMMGRDLYHPESISRDFAQRAPNVTFLEHWKEPEHLEATERAVLDFLAPQSRG